MLSVISMVNEYRNNRITVDFVSKDGAENDSWLTLAMVFTVLTSRIGGRRSL
jgi:hypothetical protein